MTSERQHGGSRLFALKWPQNATGIRSASSAICLVTAFLVYLAFTYQSHLQIWDDGYISFRFARNLAQGHGLVWNIGQAHTEGFTSMLHVLLLSAGIKIGIGPSVGSLIISVSSVTGTLLIMVAILRRQLGAIGPLSALVIGLYAADRATAIHSTSGLETQLFVLLLAASYLAALSAIDRSSWRLSVAMAILMVLSVLARPEGAVYGMAIYGVLLTYTAYGRYRRVLPTQRLLHVLASAAIVLAIGLSYIIWKLSYFGYLFPNPFYVKSARLSLEGVDDVLLFLIHIAFWLAPTLLVLIALYSRRMHWKRLVILPGSNRQWAKVSLTIIPPLMVLSYYLTITHEVGGAFRFSYPTYFFVAIGLAAYLGLLPNLTKTKSKSWGVAATAAVLIIMSQVVIFQGAFVMSRSGLSTTLPISPLNDYHHKIADALLDTGLKDEAIVLADAAGIIPYVSEFSHVDRIGLTDNYLSGRSSPTPAQREAYMWQQKPDVYIGYEPPAHAGAERPQDDPVLSTPYMTESFMKQDMTAITSRIYPADADILHFRMRELRDNWHLVGEMDWAGQEMFGLKSLVYVRNDSPHYEVLTASFEKAVTIRHNEFSIDDLQAAVHDSNGEIGSGERSSDGIFGPIIPKLARVVQIAIVP